MEVEVKSNLAKLSSGFKNKKITHYSKSTLMTSIIHSKMFLSNKNMIKIFNAQFVSHNPTMFVLIARTGSILIVSIPGLKRVFIAPTA